MGRFAQGPGVPPARLINTTAPVAGGGDLSNNRTISMPAATAVAAGHMTAAQAAALSAATADVAALEALAPVSFVVPSDGTYQTIGAVLVAVPTGFTPTDARRYKYEASVWAKNAAGDTLLTTIRGVVTRVAGVSVLGRAHTPVSADATAAGLAAAVIAVVLVGNEVNVNCTGVVLETLTWGVRLDTTELPDV